MRGIFSWPLELLRGLKAIILLLVEIRDLLKQILSTLQVQELDAPESLTITLEK